MLLEQRHCRKKGPTDFTDILHGEQGGDLLWRVILWLCRASVVLTVVVNAAMDTIEWNVLGLGLLLGLSKREQTLIRSIVHDGSLRVG